MHRRHTSARSVARSFCFATVIVTAVPCHAQQVRPASPGEEIVVTATRFDEQQYNLPVGVTVLNAEDIRRSTAQTLPELLSQVAGILVRDNTGSPDQQVDIRGFGITGDQNSLVLVLSLIHI